MSAPRYIDSLTPLRGIAAFAVLLFHYDLCLVLMGFAPIFPPEVTRLVHRGYLWVDFFFVLSGFVIAHVYGEHLRGGLTGRSVWTYLVARFSRIYPLHIFTLLTHVGLFVLLLRIAPLGAQALADTLYAVEALPLHVFMLHAMNLFPRQTWNTPSWSIAAEWWTYVIALVLVPWIYDRARWRAVLAGALALGALFVMITLHPKQSLRINFDYGVLRCLFGFTLGVVVQRFFADGWARARLSSDLAFVAASALSLGVMHFETHDVAAPAAFGSLVLTAAHNQGWAHRVLNTRPLRWFGDISYSFYMVQMWPLIVFTGLLDARKKVQGVEASLGARVTWLLVLFVMVLLASWATYRWLELPARDWLRARLQPRRDPPVVATAGGS